MTLLQETQAFQPPCLGQYCWPLMRRCAAYLDGAARERRCVTHAARFDAPCLTKACMPLFAKIAAQADTRP